MTDHNELAARIERAEGPDRALDIIVDWFPEHPPLDITADLVKSVDEYGEGPPHYTGSLDAAMQLVPEGWHTFLMYTDRHSGSCRWELRKRACDRAESRAATPALALCAAAIRARSAS